MRVRPALSLCLVTAVLLAAPASAQDDRGEPGCAQSNPCEVYFSVTADGIVDLSYDLFASGDWIIFDILNEDAQAHTLRLEGHSLEVTVEAGDIEGTPPLQLGSPGVYELRDTPTGDTADITVQEEEVFTDPDGETTGKSNPTPGPAPALLVLGLAAAVAVSRRK